MTAAPSDKTLDHLLALQLTIAWAGEGLCKPKRLDWWKTDLIDADGGGDLLARLLPKTHQWASLEATRLAAIRTDEGARSKLANPDAVRTLFFWGFAVDEKLGDRLAFHKRAGRPPSETLPLQLPLTADFDQEALEDQLATTKAKHEVVPGGRELDKKTPADLDNRASVLAAALLPFADKYPMPFIRVKA